MTVEGVEATGAYIPLAAAAAALTASPEAVFAAATAAL